MLYRIGRVTRRGLPTAPPSMLPETVSCPRGCDAMLGERCGPPAAHWPARVAPARVTANGRQVLAESPVSSSHAVSPGDTAPIDVAYNALLSAIGGGRIRAFAAVSQTTPLAIVARTSTAVSRASRTSPNAGDNALRSTGRMADASRS